MHKKFILTAIILMLAAGPAFSGCPMCGGSEGKTVQPEKKADKTSKKVKQMTKSLALTEQQALQLEALMREKMDKKKAVHEEAEKKMELIRKEYQDKLKTVLTPEQLEKYNARKDKHGKKDRNHKKHKHD
ncbi:MAG: hypothetical protein AB7S78_00990 [Candidatus Omnitrophota bacterium]